MNWSVPSSLRRVATEVEGWLEFGCFDRALEKVAPLLETPGARPVGLFFQASALIRLERHEEALEVLGECRHFEHDGEWVDLSEAWCLKRTDNIEGAAECMRRLIARNSKSAIGHFNLGCYLALLGDEDTAIDEVALACGLDPDFRALARDEADLEALRCDDRFTDLLPPSLG